MKVIFMMYSKKFDDCKQNPMEQLHEQMKNDFPKFIAETLNSFSQNLSTTRYDFKELNRRNCISTGPKSYAYIVNNLSEKCKIKGFFLNYENS